MYPIFDIHTWTSMIIAVVLFSLSHVSPCWFPTWSCILILICTHGLVSLCWYPHLLIYRLLVTLIWSWILILIFSFFMCHRLTFTLGYGFLCWHFHLFMLSHVDIHVWSSVSVLKEIYIHISPYSFSCLVIYSTVAIHTYICKTVLLFLIGHVSLCWYSHLVLLPMLLF